MYPPRDLLPVNGLNLGGKPFLFSGCESLPEAQQMLLSKRRQKLFKGPRY